MAHLCTKVCQLLFSSLLHSTFPHYHAIRPQSQTHCFRLRCHCRIWFSVSSFLSPSSTVNCSSSSSLELSVPSFSAGVSTHSWANTASYHLFSHDSCMLYNNLFSHDCCSCMKTWACVWTWPRNKTSNFQAYSYCKGLASPAQLTWMHNTIYL